MSLDALIAKSSQKFKIEILYKSSQFEKRLFQSITSFPKKNENALDVFSQLDMTETNVRI